MSEYYGNFDWIVGFCVGFIIGIILTLAVIY